MARGPAKKTVERNSAAAKISDEEILEVFEFWKLTFNKKRASLDHVRKVLLGSAIFHYGVDGAKDAIKGCTFSDFHMGRNKNNKAYTGIDNIFKDNERIEKMMSYLPEDHDSEEGVDW
jgi:hypothetical protein